jgi:ATP-dependent Lon protease
VGAVKAKVIGGFNQGLKRFIIPKLNQKDLENIPSEAKIFPVENYQEVLKIIFAKSKEIYSAGERTYSDKQTQKRTKNNPLPEKKRRRISSSV